MRQQYSNWMTSFYFLSKWSLVKLGSLVKVFKDLWEWNQDSTANLFQSAAKVWRKMRGTQQTDETVSWEEMSRFVCVFHPVTVAFRFHECVADGVSGQVSRKSTMLLLPCRIPSISLNFLRVGKIFQGHLISRWLEKTQASFRTYQVTMKPDLQTIVFLFKEMDFQQVMKTGNWMQYNWQVAMKHFSTE